MYSEQLEYVYVVLNLLSLILATGIRKLAKCYNLL